MKYYLDLVILLTVSSVCCESRPTDIFTSHFPCLPSQDNNTDIRGCDVFVYSAVQLALERYQREFDRTVNFTDLLGNQQDSTEVLYDIYTYIAAEGNLGVDRGISITRGLVGPGDNYIANRVMATIARILNLPMISYGLSDSRLDEFDNFYRTIPSTTALNQARLRLIAQFDWYRIGVISSEDPDYVYQMESFSDFYEQFVEREENAELSYEGVSSELASSLRDLLRLDIRIIVAFFGPQESRNLLCKARQFGLTSADHVWILPSYYSPDWWREAGASNCSDQEMIEILNSVIFLDPVKFPTFGTSLSGFYRDVVARTRENFPGAGSEQELMSLLQHSRAVSAYDSALLLAYSLTDNRSDTTILRSRILCEECRIYPDESILDIARNFCRNALHNCSQYSTPLSLPDPQAEIEREFILFAYGQVLITQFINGSHCPVVLFWPTSDQMPELIDINFRFLSELSNHSYLRELEVVPEIAFPNSNNCPQHFVWKDGRPNPPSSNRLLTTSIPSWALAIVGLWTLLSEILIVSLLIFNIIWRENKRVRPTSPKINVVILAGAGVAAPYSLVEGLVLAGRDMGMEEQSVIGTILCQFYQIIPLIGFSLFLSGTVAKLYRLYRIFHNKKLKAIKHVNDWYLILLAVLIIIPVTALLIIWDIVDPALYNIMRIDNGRLQFIEFPSCIVRIGFQQNEIFDLVLRGYIALLLTFSICLSLLVTSNHFTKAIKRDLYVTRVVLFAGYLVLGVAFAAKLSIDRLELYELTWWLSVLDGIVLITFMVSGLFIYPIPLVIKDYFEKVKKKYQQEHFEAHEKYYRSSSSKAQEEYYESLLDQVRRLSQSLAEKEAAIIALKKTRPTRTPYKETSV